MAKAVKTQWHPAFCSAMRLELKEDAEYLEYMNEYNLNTKPLQMDMLIVKKLQGQELKNEIGKLFRTHNIVEYKSPDDSLNVNTYLKVVAYACLYKTYEEHIDEIVLEDITITMVRARKPIKLFRWFQRNGYEVTEKYKGIYYVTKENHFLTQVLVSSRLSKENQKWLTLLSRDLVQADAERVVCQLESLESEAEKNHGDSVLQVAMQENEALFRQLKEDGKEMCQALRELFEPELKEAVQQGMQQGIQQGVRDMIARALKAGNSMEDISRITQVPMEEIQAIGRDMCNI